MPSRSVSLVRPPTLLPPSMSQSGMEEQEELTDFGPVACPLRFDGHSANLHESLNVRTIDCQAENPGGLRSLLSGARVVSTPELLGDTPLIIEDIQRGGVPGVHDPIGSPTARFGCRQPGHRDDPVLI